MDNPEAPPRYVTTASRTGQPRVLAPFVRLPFCTRGHMDKVSCPQCGEAGRLLLDEGWEDYCYCHCDGCQTTWLIDQREPELTPVLLATLKKDRKLQP